MYQECECAVAVMVCVCVRVRARACVRVCHRAWHGRGNERVLVAGTSVRTPCQFVGCAGCRGI